MPMPPADRDRARAKLLEVRQRLREALRLIREALQNPNLPPQEWVPRVREEVQQAQQHKRWELLIQWPGALGVRFEDLYILLNLFATLQVEIGRWHFDGNDAWVDTVLDAIEDLLRHLDQMASGADPLIGSDLTRMGDLLRRMRGILRRLRGAMRFWFWRWIAWVLFRRRLADLSRVIGSLFVSVGEEYGTEELEMIVRELGQLDRAMETLPIPQPETTRQILERILATIDRLFPRLDRLGQ